MTNINITNFRKNVYELVDQTIQYNNPVSISTKNGNAILLSEKDYYNMIESLYISSIKELRQKIIEEGNVPLNECLTEEEVNW